MLDPSSPSDFPLIDQADLNALNLGLAPAMAMAQIYMGAATASQLAALNAVSAQAGANTLLLEATASGVKQILDLKQNQVWSFVTNNSPSNS